MLYASEEEQKAFHSGHQKQLKLTFSDGTIITNEDIALENFSIEQSISSGNQLEFGKVSSACMKVQVLNVVQRFKGLQVHAEITARYLDETFTRSLGWYTVESDKATSDRIGRDLECYDALYPILTNDYSEWHNSLSFPMTFKEYRDAFFEYVGLEQEEYVLPNDDIVIQKNFVSDNYSGNDVIRNICEFNGVCGEIDYDGEFRYIVLTVDIEGLYPSDNLYPVEPDTLTHEGLYPRDPESYILHKNFYVSGSLRYEEFECHQITQLQIRMSEGDIGTIVGSEGNTYIIQDNPLFYGMNPEELDEVATNIFSMIRAIYYTPSSVSAPASPWFQLGDVVKIISDKDSPIICVVNRKMSGITKLIDEYSCEGEEYYSEKANSTMHNITVLRQKTNELFRNVEENRLTITETQTDLNDTRVELQSEIRQTAESITLSVNQRVDQVVADQDVINGQVESELADKVKKGTISSEISIESGQINIASDRVSITSTNFVLNSDGEITLCKKANIGGFTIDDTSFRSNESKTTGVYLSPNTTTPRSIINYDGSSVTRNCLFAIGNNFGVTSNGTVYINGAISSRTSDGYCTINNGVLDLKTDTGGNLIHLYHGSDVTLGIGVDDIYFDRRGKDKVYLNQSWDELLSVTTGLYKYKDSLVAVAKYWNKNGGW